MNVIMERREQMGMTQQQLAALVGCTSAHLSYIENGQRQPSVTLAKRIADILHIEWSSIFEESGADA